MPDGLPLGPALLARLGIDFALKLGLEGFPRVRVELEIVLWGAIRSERCLGRALEKLKLALLLAGERNR
jgi:hypothetical protein